LRPTLFKHWINLLCLASQHDDEGALPDVQDVAFRLRVRRAEAEKILEELTALGLLDRCEVSAELVRVSAHNWQKRQRVSDVSSQRVALHRAAKQENVTLPVTLHETVPDTDTEKEKEKPPKSPSGGLGGFDDFWTCYPRREGKQAAVKAWQKLRPDETLRKRIVTAVKAAARSRQWTKDDGQFIPLPATYLNGRRWEDELLVRVAPTCPPGKAWDATKGRCVSAHMVGVVTAG
jgi:hypothetical protein